ncbi:MAG: hypothetical protein PeribacterA2_0087 [Candidatus Peribacter riflensis]|uniref:Uncharacterized protein n=1 Tax=Candidatus Peribacter riflensis TaxID=1735162 RepID=A0A0S1SHY1_9BACT|nr:MAG: hypothetical protein PeribacterA2_0087 [Candidatus Peribacter riflensis]ALM10585.1 MAG: hypothetical protein PeribacterB2_0087 [Candidatus Peribacter riflensis]ALM11687.1 MAG: hypothetical protein PeribacterC2_0086 [Candidatus Peribacter riflensis]ALM12790.1 MAG: hypothetical protein PeribacterD1_0087 [Candidatus Peribacter riflensis]ALM13891.1 MAG: hypothetical protein PeribacterD2_0087 [Candidatus Peribacter riflensis]
MVSIFLVVVSVDAMKLFAAKRWVALTGPNAGAAPLKGKESS